MTRETKIGLVVGTSFLCLVGIVVASKWRQEADPSEQQGNQVAAVGPTETKGKDGAEKNDKPNPQPAPTAKKEEPKKNEFPVAPLLPPLQQGSFQTEFKPNEGSPLPTLPPLPPPTNVIVPAPLPVTNSGQPVRPLTELEKKEAPLIPAPVAVGVRVEGQSPILPVIEEKKTPIPMPPPLTMFDEKKLPIPQPPALAIEQKNFPINNGGVESPPSLPPLGKEAAPKPPELPIGPFPAVGGLPNNNGQNPSIPSPPKDNSPINSTPMPIPTIPPFNINAQVPQPVVGGNRPVVKEFDLKFYECRQGDSTFTILSQRIYGTDKYADALHAYNYANSSLVSNGANLKLNPPLLNLGQQVVYPPLEVLERDYRNYIREASVNPMPKVTITPPTPLTPGVATVGNPPSQSSGRTYTVKNANGESILDIAERVLGSRGRWNDIYQLNRANAAVQPQFRIPAGTELKMPAN